MTLQGTLLSMGRFETVFWIDATNKDTLEQSYKDIAFVHAPKTHTEYSLQSALSWFEHLNYEWLLIFDGADDDEAAAGLLPPGSHGNILYTSRNHMAITLPENQTIKVNGLKPDDAVRLLLKAARIEETALNRATRHKDHGGSGISSSGHWSSRSVYS